VATLAVSLFTIEEVRAVIDHLSPTASCIVVRPLSVHARARARARARDHRRVGRWMCECAICREPPPSSGHGRVRVQVRTIARGALFALHWVHDHCRVVHRDLHPVRPAPQAVCVSDDSERFRRAFHDGARAHGWPMLPLMWAGGRAWARAGRGRSRASTTVAGGW
jgi:hypothetical protein